MRHAFVSVIIPVLHEATTINDVVDHVFNLPWEGGREVIVADGAQEGDTLAALAARPEAGSGQLVLVNAPAGRARQMNAGAARARGEVYLFLHADTRLPRQGLALAAEVVTHSRGAGAGAGAKVGVGAFSLGVDTHSPTLKALVRLADLRNRIARTPYGDQAQFFCADVFRELGGYADIPLMEDVEIMRRLRGAGRTIVVLDERVTTSARRWEKEGLWYASLRNMTLRLLYGLGASPHWLARWYRPANQKNQARDADAIPTCIPENQTMTAFANAAPPTVAATTPAIRPSASDDRETILFFVREPVPGKVKTRLATVLGDERAAALYRCFVQDMHEGLSALTAPVTVCHHPPAAGPALRNLLGPDAHCVAQEGPNLGERMKRALARAFESGAERAVLLGSDLPDLPPALVQRGLDELRSRGAVLGPAMDGGYYLIGFARDAFAPSAFDGVDWGGPQVLRQTTARLRDAGVAHARLPEWNDVDEIKDLRALLRSGRETAFRRSRTYAALLELEDALPGDVRAHAISQSVHTPETAHETTSTDMKRIKDKTE